MATADRSISYSEFAALVRRVGGGLAAAGVAPGDVVGVSLDDTPEHLVAHYAVAWLGGVILPLDPHWERGARAETARQFGAHVVVGDADEADGAPRVLAIDRLAAGRGEMAEPAELAADAPLVISLSSGTTGPPKGALVTHGQQLARFHQQWLSQEMHGRDRFLACTPLRLGAARAFSMGILYTGGSVILAPPPFEPRDLVRLAHEQSATTTFLTPALVRLLLARVGDRQPPPLEGMRLIVGGSALDADEPAAITERLGGRLLFSYAAAECGLISVATAEDLVLRPASAGQPGVEVEVQVVDDGGQPVGAGEVGRIRCRGPAVPTTFLTAEGQSSTHEAGWFDTGDVGELDTEGFLSVHGRAEGRIMRRGVAVLPEAVERALRGDPDIADACIVAWRQTKLANYDPDPELAAFVIAREGSDAEAAVRRMSATLAAHERPSLVVAVSSLPRTAMGKVQREQLTRQLPER